MNQSPTSQQWLHMMTSANQLTNSAQPAPPQGRRERHTIWRGVLEWVEKFQTAFNVQECTRHVPCRVVAHSRDDEPELNADSWPQKLILDLVPRKVIANIGGPSLINSKVVLFYPQPCEALTSLTQLMSSGFSGCVNLNSLSTSQCDIKLLLLLYIPKRGLYLGLIPNDQAGCINKVLKVNQDQMLNSQGQMSNHINVQQLQRNLDQDLDQLVQEITLLKFQPEQQ